MKTKAMGNKHRTSLNVLFACLVFVLAGGCVSYNFTGGSMPPNIKTISIQSFYNQSGNGPPSMSLQLTEKIKSFYQNNTKLLIVKENGDWKLEGMITKYYQQPIAPQGNLTAGQMRLTITINATFLDELNNREFKKDFSLYADYGQSQTFNQVEADLVNDILDRLVFLVFNETTSNW